jgi:ergothioneine biosynthesis protein EgtB
MGELFADDLAPEVAWLVELGLNHEQQHQELLLMDIKHVLGTNPLRPAYRSSPAATATRPSDAADNWIEHPGGVVTVGRAQEAEGFCFDNECPVHEALLQPFALRSQLVTCGEWLEFLADDGYQRAELWMSDGWGAIHTNDWDAPGYWERGDDGWLVYTLEGLRPVDPAEPVCHVSWYEADAFARWAGYRLPSEPEWETVARPIIEARGDVGGLCDPSVDGLHPWAGAIDDDPEQWTDAVWQWTASSYGPYPGFAPAPGAVGEYNGKFMVNQQALRGGACITPEGHTRATYRNFFYPSARWPFTGVRLAADR